MNQEEPPASPPPVPHVEFKATLLLGLMVLLVAGAALYLMYARGVFEATQRLVLVAEDAEGVRVGMDLSFSGFPVGRVQRIELAPDGNARILVDVPRKDAHWLRQSSVFTLVRSVLGGTSLRAYSGVLTDPPLPDGAERKVLVGDTGAELQRVVTTAREVLQNISAMTSSDSALGNSLADLRAVTDRLRMPPKRPGWTVGSGLRLVLGQVHDADVQIIGRQRSPQFAAESERTPVRAPGKKCQWLGIGQRRYQIKGVPRRVHGG